MKRIFFGIAIVLACGLSAGIGSAAQQQVGKGVVIKPGEAYNPNIEYAGRYKTNILFYKGSGSEFWKRLPRFDRLRYVTCPEAVQQLNKAGIWKGSLNFNNGSCVAEGRHAANSADPPDEWALGNWLNYNDQVVQQTASDKN